MLTIARTIVLIFVTLVSREAMGFAGADFDSMARKCAPAVHPATLAAVVRTESGFRPYAININGKHQLPRQPASHAEAVATAGYLLGRGFNFDSGLGQINSVNVQKFAMPWTAVFDPCSNLSAAARVLTECFERASKRQSNNQEALRNALSCYNTGTFTRGHSNGYVGRVERSAAKNPAVVVPALTSVDHSPPQTATTTAAGTIQPSSPAPVPRDAFRRVQGDAFARASMQEALEHDSRPADPAAANTLPIKLVVSSNE